MTNVQPTRRFVERRQRGVLGSFAVVVFWLFNGAMVFWLVGFFIRVAELERGLTSTAARAGHNLGVGLALNQMLTYWLLGGFITGGLMLLTRGRRELIEITHPNAHGAPPLPHALRDRPSVLPYVAAVVGGLALLWILVGVIF